jgi:hypothetical protein
VERLSSPAEVGTPQLELSIVQLEGIPGRPASGGVLETRTLKSRAARAEEVTNGEDTVPGQVIDSDEGTGDWEPVRWKTHIEGGISVERVYFKVRERRIGADGLIRSSSCGEPGGKGGDNRKN